jgi:CDGSH-type Zn-finger protein
MDLISDADFFLGFNYRAQGKILQPQRKKCVSPFARSRLCAIYFIAFVFISIGRPEKIMAVTIKALKDGPYEVTGGAKLFDHEGKEYQEEQFPPIYLCRCGQSKNKPFCDGTHSAIGFRSEETAK